MAYVTERHGLPAVRACRLLGLASSTYHYKSERKRDDSHLRKALSETAERKSRSGRPYMVWYLRERLKMMDNHKRIARVYREMNLQVTKRPKRRKFKTGRTPLYIAPTRPNELWAMDFVSDAFSSGRRFRVFTLKDLYTHEALCLYVDRSIPGASVARELSKVIADRCAKPDRIICDNGTEFVSKAMDLWEMQLA